MVLKAVDGFNEVAGALVATACGCVPFVAGDVFPKVCACVPFVPVALVAFVLGALIPLEELAVTDA